MSEAEISASDIYLKEKVILEKGKFYMINGRSGKGKSSILNIIYQLNLSYEGSVTFDGFKEYSVKDFKSVVDLRRTKLSYVFQDFKLFPELSILENIQIKNELTNQKTIDEINDLIERVGLGGKSNQMIQTLSLGQRQRVALIRALCQPFEFLLLDEPFSHLDRLNANILIEIIKQALKNNGAGLIVTSLEEVALFNYDKIFTL